MPKLWKRFKNKVRVCNDVLCLMDRRYGPSKSEVNSLVWIPTVLRPAALTLAHDAVVGGSHSAYPRTLEKLQASVFWPHMPRDVRRWIKDCDECALFQTNPNMKHPITPMKLAVDTWDRVHIDLIGPLQETPSMKKYILTCVDALSGFALAFPIENKTAETVSRVLISQVISIFGPPQYIVSDRGTEFVNDTLDKLLIRWGIKHIVTSPFNPAANGKVERFNQTLTRALRPYVNRKQDNWDLLIPLCVYTYNFQPSDRYHVSPADLVFAWSRKPAVITWLLNVMPDNMPEESTKLFDNILKHMGLQGIMLSAIRATNKKYIEKAKAMEGIEYFQPEDIVLMKSRPIPGMSSKLQRKWDGPYKIQRVVHERGRAYVIKRSDETGGYQMAHGRNLKLYKPRDSSTVPVQKPESGFSENLQSSTELDTGSSEKSELKSQVEDTLAQGSASEKQQSTSQTKPQMPLIKNSQRGRPRESDYEPIPENEYLVKEILDQKELDGKLYYLVKWSKVGEQIFPNSWERQENLNCPELIRKFKRVMKARKLAGVG